MRIVIPFYNFSGSTVFVQNHMKTLDAMTEQGFQCLTVEATLTNCPPCIAPVYQDHWHLRLKTNAVLWHKETLINIGYRWLKAHDKWDGKILWLDSGCIPEPGLFERAERLLDEVDCVQAFSTLRRLDATGAVEDDMSSGAVQAKNYLDLHGDFESRGRKSFRSPGGAWASTDRFFTEMGGLYEFMVVGGGDTVFFHPLLNIRTWHTRYNTTPEWNASQLEWQTRMSALGLTWTYAPGMLTHLWHIKQKNRRCGTRQDILGNGRFNPDMHLKHAKNGLLQWCNVAGTRQRAMVKQVENYMRGRTNPARN